MKSRRLFVPAIAVLLALVGAACSGDDDSGAADATTTSAAVTATTTAATTATTSATTATSSASATTTTAAATTTRSATATTASAAAATTTTAVTPTTAAATTTTATPTTTAAPTTTEPPAEEEPPAPPAPTVTGTITVFAATSLTNAFNDLANGFEAANPGTDVRYNFNGSSTLVTQIFQGAEADVFASADTDNMDRLVDSGLISGTPIVFTNNRMMIAVQKGNPKNITTVADLARSDVATVLCAAPVPCGRYARQIFAAQGVSVTPKSNEQNVGNVVARIARGEADAGIVYFTDVVATPTISGVEIPGSQNVVATYPLASPSDATNAFSGQAFIDYVLSPAGQAVLARYSFLPR